MSVHLCSICKKSLIRDTDGPVCADCEKDDMERKLAELAATSDEDLVRHSPDGGVGATRRLQSIFAAVIAESNVANSQNDCIIDRAARHREAWSTGIAALRRRSDNE